MTTGQGHLLIHAYGADPDAVVDAALRVSRNAANTLRTGAVIHLVIQGPAVSALKKNGALHAEIRKTMAEPRIQILACENSMAAAGIEHSELVNGVQTAPAAVTYLAEKQWQGWAYVRI